MEKNSIAKFAFYLMVLMVYSLISIGCNAEANVTNITGNVTSLELAIIAHLDALQAILFSMIQILFSSSVIALFIVFVLWIIRKDRDLIILPFVVANKDGEYNGEAISHLVIAELQRIKQITDAFNPQIMKITEKLAIPSLMGEDASKIPNIGTIGISSATISIGELMFTIKHLFPGRNRQQVITGCFEVYGSEMKLMAYLKGDKNYTWEVYRRKDERKIQDSIADFDKVMEGNKKETFVSDLVRDLSFKIAYDLSKGSISAKTMLGFRYFTEACGNYLQYLSTQLIEDLERSENICIMAFNIERNYRKPFDLLLYVGWAYWYRKMEDKAVEIFSKAAEVDPQSAYAWFYKGWALYSQGKYDETIKAYDKAIKLSPDDEIKFGIISSLREAAAALLNQGMYDMVIKVFDQLLEVDPKNSAWYWEEKGLAFKREGRTTEAEEALEKAKASIQFQRLEMQ